MESQPPGAGISLFQRRQQGVSAPVKRQPSLRSGFLKLWLATGPFVFETARLKEAGQQLFSNIWPSAKGLRIAIAIRD